MFEVLLVLPALLRQDVYIVLSITLYHAKADYFRNQTFLFCPIIFNTTKVMPSVVSQGVAWQFSKIGGYVMLQNYIRETAC